MKHILLTKQFLLLVLSTILLLSTSCIKDDLDECSNLTLKVVNYKNDDVTPLGAVKDVSLYVFDENKTLLETVQLDQDFIVNRKAIALNYPEGKKLTLVAYGNLSGGNQIVKAGTKAEELLVSVKTAADGLASSPDSIFYGNKVVETYGAGGFVGGNQEIVIQPRTGTLTMQTVNLSKAAKRRGLLKSDAEETYQFQVDRTIESLDYNGEETGNTVYYKPGGVLKNQEWITPERTNMYDNKNLEGTIYYNGAELQSVEVGTYADGTVGPITVQPQQNTLVQFEWDENGAFLGAKVKVTPWGVVDNDIDW
ncbi:FimB/Mfa2 family fimbrial subunit [Parabacteroides chongii]|uniref:FimB/Mfa2 family fimbrial subunit n=1 Tax=Parabacteroides chongii TaxID=2685834 RepID=UPI00240E1905|nr:FimB/Mfa2 family fimbrial subunit [Parabacteroides chongii]WFE86721.1 FimB/Mfa2 family fimbrial subunit [Parabacteroides chongii]